MLLSTRERFLLLSELNLATYRNQGVPLKLVAPGAELDVSSLLKKALADGKTKIQLSSSDQIRITHLVHYPADEMVAILFRRGDPRAAAQIYENKAGDLRRSDKTDEDLVAVSCHLFIGTKRYGDGRYRAVLEEVPSLGRTYVQRLISLVTSGHKYNSKNAKGVEKETYTNARLDGIASEKLGESEGTFDYIELVKQADTDGLDVTLVVPRQQKMVLKIQAGAPNVLERIRGVKDWAIGRGWTDVRVKIRFPEGQSRLVDVSRENDAADVLFVRSEPVTVKTPMDACTDKVNSELMALAKAKLNGPGWT